MKDENPYQEIYCSVENKKNYLIDCLENRETNYFEKNSKNENWEEICKKCKWNN